MKALIQRVSQASVTVNGREVSAIGAGLLVFLGVESGDTRSNIDFLVKKVSNLRIFEDNGGKMNLSVTDVSGELLVVSQFTLAADVRKGNRPSFVSAEEPEVASKMYAEFVELLRSTGLKVATGEFAAHMDVSLINDGPVTIMIDSSK